MSVRRLFAGVATTSVVAASLSLAAPALADPPAGYAPASSDIIGVGSDTSEHALNYLADGNAGVPGYNASNPANKLVSWNATAPAGAPATINIPGNAAANRPNGSGNGMKALYAPGNVPEIDFARSSSALDDAAKSAGLQAFPFAKDTLGLATAKNTNAPATISPADMVKIYSGAYTDWSQVPGGKAGAIAPKIPQSGSGTRKFFEEQLTANGWNKTYGPLVKEVQEHDPAAIKDDANAIAPFSVGRNNSIGAPLTIAGGFSASRALYNVVRGVDVSKPEILAVFGDSGFICSPEARPLIEAAGFDQLATKANGGVCGVPTQAASTNLLTSQKVATTTTVAGTSEAAGSLTLTATVAAGATKPSGVVRFYLDGSTTASGNPAPLTGGKATTTLTGLTAGAHTVIAKFTPAVAGYLASESAATPVTVSATTTTPPSSTKAKTSLKVSFKKAYKKGAKAQGVVMVKESAAGTPSGKIVIKLGKKVVATGKLVKGKAKVTIKTAKLKTGKNKLVVMYAGDKSFAASKKKFTVTVK